MMPDDKTQKEKEEEARTGPAGILSSILGFAGPIAGFIPSLLKGPQEDFLRRQQAGEGAGAAIGRQTASEAARRVIGASTAQPSSGRGGNLREGLRAADALVQRGAQQAAITGARESQAATQQLRANQFARRGAARKFGAGVGQGLAGIAGTLAAARDQGEVQPESGEAAGQTPGVLPQDPTGLGGQIGVPGLGGIEQQQFQDQLTRVQTAQNPVGPPATPEQLFPQQSPVASQLAQPTQEAPSGQPAQDVSSGTMGAVKDTGFSEALGMQDPMAKFQLGVENLANTTADKQVAGETYQATSSSSRSPSPIAESTPVGNMSDPAMIGEYVYNQAMNYDRALNQGLDPLEAVNLLEFYGLPVDLVRLGLAEPAPAGGTTK